VDVWERGNSSSGALVYGAARESFLVEEAEWTGDAHHPGWQDSRPLGSLTWGLDRWCSFYGGHGC
jgi:hypothetical protein